MQAAMDDNPVVFKLLLQVGAIHNISNIQSEMWKKANARVPK